MTNRSTFSWDLYYQAPVVGILRGMSEGTVLEIAKAYQEAGFYTLEITMNTTGAAEIISSVKSRFPNMNIGAGTVCNVNHYREARAAGAQFIVMPIIKEDVIKQSVSEQIPIFPGAYSPTEIYRAWELGASAVKVFPATQLGVQYIRDVAAPLDKVKLLPTGGVSKDNIRAFFEAGAMGVGMGSSLFYKEFVEQHDFDGLKRHFAQIKQQISEFLKM